jgi:hypothetical protein
VYAVGHAKLTREGHLLSDVLACGDRAMLSHGAERRNAGQAWCRHRAPLSASARRSVDAGTHPGHGADAHARRPRRLLHPPRPGTSDRRSPVPRLGSLLIAAVPGPPRRRHARRRSRCAHRRDHPHQVRLRGASARAVPQLRATAGPHPGRALLSSAIGSGTPPSRLRAGVSSASPVAAQLARLVIREAHR